METNTTSAETGTAQASRDLAEKNQRAVTALQFTVEEALAELRDLRETLVYQQSAAFELARKLDLARMQVENALTRLDERRVLYYNPNTGRLDFAEEISK